MRNKGLMFAIMYACSTFASISQLKIVPVMGQIAESLSITYAEISWLMSIFTIAGIVLAIPAGGLVGKFGPKKVFIAVMAVMIAGNVVGALGIGSYPVLLLSRILEGIGFAMVSVAGIVLINMWFPDKNSGLFVGIFMTFAAVASVLALNFALPIAIALGMTSLWWITAGVSAVLTVLFAMVVKEAAPPAGAPGAPMEKPQLAPIFKNGMIMALCIAQLVIGFFLYFFMTNYPTVFGTVYGVDAATANFYGGLNGLWGIPGCILGGYLLDRLGKKGAAKLDLVCFAVMAVAGLMLTALVPGLYIVHTVLTSVFPGLVLTAGNYLIPRCVDSPAQIGYGIGTLGLFYNIGIFAGNPIIMYAVQGTGDWSMASYILTAVSVVGFVAVIIYLSIAKKRDANQLEAPQA